MMLAHVGGIPLEEWLFPVIAAGGGLAAAVRARIGHDVGRRRMPPPEGGRRGRGANEALTGGDTEWGDHLTDDEYPAADAT